MKLHAIDSIPSRRRDEYGRPDHLPKSDVSGFSMQDSAVYIFPKRICYRSVKVLVTMPCGLLSTARKMRHVCLVLSTTTSLFGLAHQVEYPGTRKSEQMGLGDSFLLVFTSSMAVTWRVVTPTDAESIFNINRLCP